MKLIETAIDYVKALSAYGEMLLESCKDVLGGRLDLAEVQRQIVRIGMNSIPIVLLTSVFTGMVLALQTAYGLQRFGAKNYVGNIVGLAIVRELGPVLTALMLCGRVGSGIAAEIASMAATEQIDAIRALGASPSVKLITPKIVAALIVVPLLVVIANLTGIYGGGLIAVFELNLTSHTYYQSIMNMIVIRDLIDGVIKSAVFGFLLVSIACYKGMVTKGGTEGVGRSATEAVVVGSIVIFVSDFFITKMLIILQF